jgi:formylmethanofuran dehydrogenase subunit E
MKRQAGGEDVTADRKTFMMEKSAAILNAEDNELFSIQPAVSLPPEEAKVRSSLRCSQCGEKFMDSRGREKNLKKVCIPCSEKG